MREHERFTEGSEMIDATVIPYTPEQFTQFIGAEILLKGTLIRRRITVLDDPSDLFERYVFVDGSPVGQTVKGRADDRSAD